MLLPGRIATLGTLAALALSSAVIGVQAAQAAPGPFGPPRLSSLAISPNPAAQGDTVTITGTDCADGAVGDPGTATVTITSPSGATAILNPQVVPANDMGWTINYTANDVGTFSVQASCDFYTDVYPYPVASFDVTGGGPGPSVAPILGPLKISSNPAAPGSTVTITGTDCADDSVGDPGTATVAITSPSGATTVNNPVVVPGNDMGWTVSLKVGQKAGTYAVKATCRIGPDAADVYAYPVAHITVSGRAAIANTGFAGSELAIIASALIALGAASVHICRRRMS